MRLTRIGKFAVRAIVFGLLLFISVAFFSQTDYSDRYSDFLGGPYSELLALAAFFGLVLLVTGIILLLSPRARQSDFGVPNSFSAPEELILADVRVPNASPDRFTRFPLGRKFSAMPHVALFTCALFLFLGTIFWTITPLTPKGYWVHIVKPKPLHVLAGVPDDPIIVSVRRASSPAFDKPALYVNSQPVEWENLRANLHAQLSRQPNVVYVDGDANLPYQHIVQIVDVARAAWPDVPVVLKTPGLDGSPKKHR